MIERAKVEDVPAAADMLAEASVPIRMRSIFSEERLRSAGRW